MNMTTKNHTSTYPIVKIALATLRHFTALLLLALIGLLFAIPLTRKTGPLL